MSDATMSRKVSPFPTAALAVALALAGCSPGDGKPDAAGGKDKKGPGGGGARGSRQYLVRTDVVSTRPLKYEIETTGSLQAQDVYRVDAQVPGAVEGVAFREGDEVTPETVLCRIAPETYRLAAQRAEDAYRSAVADLSDTQRRATNDIERQKVTLAEAEGDLERRRPAVAAGALSEQELSSYRNKRDLARVNLKDAEQAAVTLIETKKTAIKEKETQWAIAKEDLRKSVVVPPMAGVIEQRLIADGATVAPGAPIAQLVDRRLKLKFTLPERESGKVREGIDIAFAVQAYPGRTFAARIYRIGDLADPKTRLVTCWASVPPSDARLKSGFFASVKIVAEEKKNAVVVPLAAVLPTERGFVSFVVADGKAFRRTVTLGLQVADEAVEILGGLKEGETIVREGASSLQDGVPVKDIGASPAGDKPASNGRPAKNDAEPPAPAPKAAAQREKAP